MSPLSLAERPTLEKTQFASSLRIGGGGRLCSATAPRRIVSLREPADAVRDLIASHSSPNATPWTLLCSPGSR